MKIYVACPYLSIFKGSYECYRDNCVPYLTKVLSPILEVLNLAAVLRAIKSNNNTCSQIKSLYCENRYYYYKYC